MEAEATTTRGLEKPLRQVHGWERDRIMKQIRKNTICTDKQLGQRGLVRPIVCCMPPSLPLFSAQLIKARIL